MASAFSLAHHYPVMLVWGFYPQVNDSCLVIIGFARNKIDFVYFLCFYAHKGMTTFEKMNGFEILLGKKGLKHQFWTA